MLLVVQVVPAVSAFHDNNLPLLGEGSTTGAGWAAWTLGGSLETLVLEVDLKKLSPGSATSLAVIDGNGDTFRWTFAYPADSDGPRVRTDVAPGVDADLRTTTPAGDGSYSPGIGLGWGAEGAPLPVRVVFIAAGNVGEWTIGLRGSEGALVERSTAGSEVFLLDEDSLASPLQAEVGQSGVGASAHVRGEGALTVDHALYGEVVAWDNSYACAGYLCHSAGHLDVRMQTPDGEVQDCRGMGCAFNGASSGEYKLKFDKLDTASSTFATVCTPLLPARCSVVDDGRAQFLALFADVDLGA